MLVCLSESILGGQFGKGAFGIVTGPFVMLTAPWPFLARLHSSHLLFNCSHNSQEWLVVK